MYYILSSLSFFSCSAYLTAPSKKGALPGDATTSPAPSSWMLSYFTSSLIIWVAEMSVDWLKHGSLVLANTDWLNGDVYSTLRCEMVKVLRLSSSCSCSCYCCCCCSSSSSS
jgi:hypothetical protein